MDHELEAMRSVQEALSDLDNVARGRVLAWTASKFEIEPPADKVVDRPSGDTVHDREDHRGREYTNIDDLVDGAQPTDGPERALVVGYWLQEIEGRDGWGGGDVNSALKNLGHPLANVTKTLTSLRERRPALVMQVAKSGRSAQARKTYKLTAAGLREVRQMLGGGSIDGVA